ncbi:MAG: SH3 domain-containing protein [Caldilinea sp.]|nr:SH3 domain-containing protein [Caldilinea sp.]MCB9113453.1 SH3 domain-containing protein [Caldilineaceae bacterium]MCB9122030.1 SH3 domain-containing protein [Caldilineaceae bacterium]MCB9124363.1 SH3 domain-containing protein [Caldilineaceae bacterium]MCW5842713.1 SH3 domain-containing protein [Caldilinea sp.]
MLLLLAATLMLLAACGPAQAASNDEQVRAETARIAQQFQADQDASAARAALDGLDVANPRQWLMLQTEDLIASGADPALAAALVELTEALDIQSAAIRSYAQQQGLAEPTPTFELAPVEPVVVQGESAQSSQAAPAEAAATPDSAPAPTATPTAVTLAALPTATPEPVAPTSPQGKSTGLINVRSGPGTEFGTVAALNPDEAVDIVGKNPAGDWWQVTVSSGATGWVFGQLLQTSGDVSSVAVASDIPTPPPAAPAAEAPAEVATEAPVAEAPAEQPAEQPAPVADGPDFRVTNIRLWDVFENGGFLDGPTVTCGEKRQLVAVVLDANGSPINGVAVKGLLGAQETIVTGSQGKGDGQAEFVLGGGQYLAVAKDADGREVTSDTAYGLTTDPREIPIDTLIAAQYCTDQAQCNTWVNSPYPPCKGHYSWTVTFQRKY